MSFSVSSHFVSFMLAPSFEEDVSIQHVLRRACVPLDESRDEGLRRGTSSVVIPDRRPGSGEVAFTRAQASAVFRLKSDDREGQTEFRRIA